MKAARRASPRRASDESDDQGADDLASFSTILSASLPRVACPRRPTPHRDVERRRLPGRDRDRALLRRRVRVREDDEVRAGGERDRRGRSASRRSAARPRTPRPTASPRRGAPLRSVGTSSSGLLPACAAARAPRALHWRSPPAQRERERDRAEAEERSADRRVASLRPATDPSRRPPRRAPRRRACAATIALGLSLVRDAHERLQAIGHLVRAREAIGRELLEAAHHDPLERARDLGRALAERRGGVAADTLRGGALVRLALRGRRGASRRGAGRA